MDNEELKNLKRGDLVRSNGGWTYVIIGQTSSGDPIGIRQITLTNPSEWEKVSE